jgi:hypothetical protein
VNDTNRDANSALWLRRRLHGFCSEGARMRV